MGKQHERQTRRQGCCRLPKAWTKRTALRHSQDCLSERHSHIKCRPDAPLPAFRKAAQKAKEHDHAKGQNGRSARKAAPVGGSISRCSHQGRKPQSWQAVQTDIAGYGFSAGFRKQQDIALCRAGFAPFQSAAQIIALRFIEHGRTRNALAHVQKQGCGLLARGQRRQRKAQPHDPFGPRQLFQHKRRIALGAIWGSGFFNIQA